jgi:hypothetical protein
MDGNCVASSVKIFVSWDIVSLHRCRKNFCLVFFYRFIGEKNFGQQNCIALIDTFSSIAAHLCSVHSLVLLSQEQVPSLHIQHLPNRLRFTLQQKIALAAQKLRIFRKLLPAVLISTGHDWFLISEIFSMASGKVQYVSVPIVHYYAIFNPIFVLSPHYFLCADNGRGVHGRSYFYQRF